MYSYVFAGQGSQRPGMGSDFYQEFEESKRVFDEASESLGEDLKAICFEENPKLNLTEYTQPSILTMEMAVYEVLKKYQKHGKYFAGHSLGEYSALAAAGVFQLKDAVKIVKKRGQLMQKAVPEGVGSMAALISTDIEQYNYKEILKKHDVDLANINSKDQVVISGYKDKVENAVKEIKTQFPNIDAVFLNVSAPFHSRLMKEIEEEFRDYISQFTARKELCVNVLSNFTGTFHQPETLIENLVRQISGSVDWIQNMKVLIQQGLPIIEIGPNRPLGKFFLTLNHEVPSIINVRSMYKVFPDIEKN
ncbi:MAG: ACP S-malonyltransferase [Leptospiraceae bacterium]|nr:ACP S-malonyltransferase [Leptospiraceae bacterium]MDW7975377.1 ACP S-malonyltransferase [Leptospiraceae bacterium]